MRVIHVEEGNTLTVYGDLEQGDCNALTQTFQGLGGFSCYRVRGDGGSFSAAVFNTVETKQGATLSFDHRLRPAITLLRLLGRRPVEHDERRSVVGLPEVQLERPLAEIASEDPSRLLSVSAESMAKTLEAHDPLPGQGGAQADPLRVFGAKAFSITAAEAYELEQSGRIVCDPSVIPTAFYRALFKLTSQNVAYYSNRRTISLELIGTPDSTASSARLQDEAVRRSKERSNQIGECPAVGPESTPDEVRAFEDWCWEQNQVVGRLQQAEQAAKYAAASEEDDRNHLRWRDQVLACPTEYGFGDEAAARRTLSLSLNELSSSVCLSQKGYFMVAGSGASQNQLCEKTPIPATFLSAAGIDFCTDMSTLVEGAKYFTTNPEWQPTDPLGMKFAEFQEGGEERFCRRVYQLYRSIFRAAELQKVTHPCVLPMGLGVFLANVPEACKAAIKRAYFQAQIDLLIERDWGFKAYIINSGAPSLVAFFQELLEKQDLSRLRCPIVLHSRDVKFVTVSLAQQGLASAYLNPSDAIAVLQGALGYFWEEGKGSHYVGEEDFVATSTAVLSRANVCLGGVGGWWCRARGVLCGRSQLCGAGFAKASTNTTCNPRTYRSRMCTPIRTA